jgi:lysyl-tRNA synthetase class 2
MAEDKIFEDRLKVLDEIRGSGVEPYAYRFDGTHTSREILERYGDIGEEKSEDEVAVAGRIVLLRKMGKAMFCHIQDSTGRIQLYLRKDDIGEDSFSLLKNIQVGDIVGVKGRVFRTRTGEVTVYVTEFRLLTKSLQQLPEKYHGLHDVELRYRQRYLDLIVNPEVKEVFLKRTRIIHAIKGVLNGRGFIEVETPTLQPIYGGANARPFVTHHNTFDMRLYLRVSNELYLKRLLIGGFEKVYEFVKDFRNEGIDRTHNPEFTQVEFYCAYGDYNDAMEIVEDIWATAAREVCGTTKVTYQGVKLDLTPPWERLSMTDAIKKYAGIDVLSMSEKELRKYLDKEEIEYEKSFTKGLLINRIFEEKCEHKLIQPVFIKDFPIETTPLCKPIRGGDGSFVERFEPYINGWELGNAYSELTDPVMQRKLLEEQVQRGRAGEEETHPMDEDFVRAIEYGMPPAYGVGIGVDRMVMLLTDSVNIRDVILFPLLRPEEGTEPEGEQEEE